MHFGDFELDQARRQLFRSGQPVSLEPRAYELLSLLVERRPRALSRAQIRDVVWPGIFVSESTLGVVVNSIRQALDDDARQPRFVRTVHGFGYAFCGEVREDVAALQDQGQGAPEEALAPHRLAGPPGPPGLMASSSLLFRGDSELWWWRRSSVHGFFRKEDPALRPGRSGSRP